MKSAGKNPTRVESPPQVYNFKDYRDFLKARHMWIRERKSFCSYEWVAKKTKISKTHIFQIFHKKCQTTLDRALALGRALELEAGEKELLALLYLRSTCGDSDLKTYFETTFSYATSGWILSRRHESAGGSRITHIGHDLNGIEVYWPYLIAQMSIMKGFQRDPEWIASHARFSMPDKPVFEKVMQQLEKEQALGDVDPKRVLGAAFHSGAWGGMAPTTRNLPILTAAFLNAGGKLSPGGISWQAFSVKREDRAKVVELHNEFRRQLESFESADADDVMVAISALGTVASTEVKSEG